MTYVMQYAYIFMYVGDTYRCMSIYVRKYTCGAHTYTPNRMQAHLHTCVRMHAHTFVCVHTLYVHACIFTYVYEGKNVHSLEYTHTWLTVYTCVGVGDASGCVYVNEINKNRWEAWKCTLGSLRWWYSFRPNHVRAVACVPVGVLCVCVRVCECACGCGCLCTSTQEGRRSC